MHWDRRSGSSRLRGESAVTLLAIGLLSLQASPSRAQQDPPKKKSRGIIILRADPQPDATPVPAPAPGPSPDAAPTPAPPVTPAVVSPPAVNPPAPVVADCARPYAHPDLMLPAADLNSHAIDRALRRKLVAHAATVVIDLDHPFAVSDDAPAAFAPWLTEVKASGGLVTIKQYCKTSRGFFSFMRHMFGSDAAPSYAAARGYDVMFQVNGADQTVTQVVFMTRRPPA